MSDQIRSFLELTDSDALHTIAKSLNYPISRFRGAACTYGKTDGQPDGHTLSVKRDQDTIIHNPCDLFMSRTSYNNIYTNIGSNPLHKLQTEQERWLTEWPIIPQEHQCP